MQTPGVTSVTCYFPPGILDFTEGRLSPPLPREGGRLDSLDHIPGLCLTARAWEPQGWLTPPECVCAPSGGVRLAPVWDSPPEGNQDHWGASGLHLSAPPCRSHMVLNVVFVRYLHRDRSKRDIPRRESPMLRH